MAGLPMGAGQRAYIERLRAAEDAAAQAARPAIAHVQLPPARPQSSTPAGGFGVRLAFAAATFNRRMLFEWFLKLRSLILAHVRGFVGVPVRQSRIAYCMACPHRYMRGGHYYCRGDNGGRGCGCGHHLLSRLTHKIRLAGWRCPMGYFGYGTDVAGPLTTMRKAEHDGS